MSDSPKPPASAPARRKGGFRVSKIPKEEQTQLLRCYLEWSRSGFQFDGRFALQAIADEYGVSKSDVLALSEHDPGFVKRTRQFIESRTALAHAAVISELTDRLVGDNAKKHSLKDMTKTAEFLAKSRSGAFGKPAAGHGAVKVEIDLSLPRPDGYDEPRRLDARVKASEALGPDLLEGGTDDGDEDPPLRKDR